MIRIRGRHPDGRPAWLLSLQEGRWAVVDEEQDRRLERMRLQPDRPRVAFALGTVALVVLFDWLPEPLPDSLGVLLFVAFWVPLLWWDARRWRRALAGAEIVVGTVRPAQESTGAVAVLLAIGLPLLLLSGVLALVLGKPGLWAFAGVVAFAVATGWPLFASRDRRLRELAREAEALDRSNAGSAPC